jgi:hypothetical protein
MLGWLLHRNGPPRRALHDELIRQLSEVGGLRRRLQEEEKRLATVEQELASLKQKPSPRHEALLQRLLDTAQGTGALLAVLALLIYGAVRIANAAFYARLGVAPEEVGLSYSAILSRAIGSIILLLTSIGLIVISIVVGADEEEKFWRYLTRLPAIAIGF